MGKQSAKSKEQLILRLVIPAQAGIGSRKFKNAYLARFARGFKSLSPPRAPRKQMFARVEPSGDDKRKKDLGPAGHPRDDKGF